MILFLIISDQEKLTAVCNQLAVDEQQLNQAQLSVSEQQLTVNFTSKMQILCHQFFFDKSEMNFSDMTTVIYSHDISDNKLISEAEVQQALVKILSEKASERTEITVNFLKLMRELLIKAMICLAQKC